jgi:hypothetical protein
LPQSSHKTMKKEITLKHMTQINETTKKYKIIKFRKSGTQKVMEKNLSLDEAKRYCSRPDTKGKNWFCGFTQQN